MSGEMFGGLCIGFIFGWLVGGLICQLVWYAWLSDEKAARDVELERQRRETTYWQGRYETLKAGGKDNDY